MTEPLAATFRRPFAEQVAAFRLRTRDLVPTATWQDLWKDQHDRAFVVAGAMKADLLADLAGAVGQAIEDGTSLATFRERFRDIVETRGWHGWTGEGTDAGEAWRTRVIYRTNMRTSYMSGRHAQLVAGDFKFWVYRHSGAETPRLQHLAWDGIALPPDHPFWSQHFPPNGWGCGCSVFGARSEAGVRRLGGDPTKRLPDGWQDTDPRTGEPKGIGKGWGYAPGATVIDDIARLVAEKAAGLPAQIAVALTNDTPPAPPPLPEVTVRPATSLADARDLIIEMNLANKRVNFPVKAELAAVNDAIQVLAQIMNRFDLPTLQAFGSGTAIAKLSPRLRNLPKASAWYSSGFNVIGWNKGGLSKKPWGNPEWRAEQRRTYAFENRVRIDRLPQDAPGRAAAERTQDDDLFGWTVVEGGDDYPRSVAIHELGHHLHSTYNDRVNAATEGWRTEGWHLAVSKYGAHNDREFVAESFVIYIHHPEQHWRIKPALLDLFKELDAHG